MTGAGSANRYVPEIDGLRTVAVLSVLFYHVGFGAVPGGFVGVDVFFVISGYLITRLISTEIGGSGRFDFLRFYVRRLRRLFPAMLATVAVSYLFSTLMLSPEEMLRFALSAATAVFSVSNFLFWFESGYFDPGADTKPLLHTWSLGVEEQFYLLWPALLLILLIKAPRWAAPTALAILCLVSLALAEYWIPRDPAAAFFLLPTRLCELGLGALLVWAQRLAPKGAAAREAMLVVGLAMIVWAAATFTDRTPFPGLNAMIPCVGTALAILGCTARWAGAPLRAAPVVWTGKISYSLYLVHWPVVVFWSIWRFTGLTAADRYAIIVVSIALAALQYYLVEQRFRHVTPRSLSNPRFLGSAAAYAAVVCIASAGVVATNGWTSRIPADRYTASSRDQRHEQQRLYCRQRDPDKPAGLFTCQNDRGKDKDIVIWGDSHALHLVAGFSEMFPDYNIQIMTQPGCPAQSGFAGYVRNYRSSETEACLARNRDALAWLEKNPSALVVISSIKLANPETLAAASEEVLARLHALGQPAIVLGDVIRPGRDLNQCRSVPRALISDATLAERCQADPEIVREEMAYDAGMKKLLGDDYVLAANATCPDGKCRFFDGDVLLFRDEGHLSLAGSPEFVRAIGPLLPLTMAQQDLD
ncbi:acyltransferase family protein [Amaricoccus sp.]|uniref:acyltransferase family protein n=1 Tax=Amaricoccus sp. TaxID=1872485 RepID=UPI001B430F29|nr:acyltransferase family protein [Amaricoccus sp.]MBP7000979.1 acyltransferase [Amaricoccus sp.]